MCYRLERQFAQGVAAALLAVAAAPAPGQKACTYSWQRIPNPSSEALCIGTCLNNLGAVAGYIDEGGDTTAAFMWSPATGRAQLPFPQGITDMKARGINDHGRVAGAMWGPTLGWKGFIWDGQHYTVIHLPAWANMIDVGGINNQEQVTGLVTNSGFGPGHAFLWSGGVLTDLGAPLGMQNATANAINEHGATTGFASTGPPPQTHAWSFGAGEFAILETPAGVDWAIARGLNNNGLIAGEAANIWSGDSIPFFGVIWTPWGMATITSPPGPAFDGARLFGVNDSGRVVGHYRGLHSPDRPIVWQGHSVEQLAPLIVPPVYDPRGAVAINRSGQILLRAFANDYVLTPHWLTGDLSGDCHVGLDDLVVLLSNFGAAAGTYPLGDVNNDGQVSLADIALMLAHWGE